MKKKCLLVCLLCCLLFGLALAEEPMTETVLFEGSQPASGGWNLALTIDTTNVNGTFDPSLISENGYFAVTYDGVQNGVYLALSDWEGGVWAQINVPSTCTQTDGMYTAVFSFEQCRMAYGSIDFAVADQICVGTSASTKTMVIHKVAWYGAAQTDSLGADEVLFSGAATSTAQNECLVFRFTQHVGGTFDASQMRTDSRLYVEYSGAKYDAYLALSSHSGATQWAKVNASETVEVSEGRYGAYFDESAMAMAFGSNFARLDQISVYSSGKQPVTLHKLAYFAGTGDVVDTSGGRWDCRIPALPSLATASARTRSCFTVIGTRFLAAATARIMASAGRRRWSAARVLGSWRRAIIGRLCSSVASMTSDTVIQRKKSCRITPP